MNKTVIIIAVIAIVAMIGFNATMYTQTEEVGVVRVLDKERITKSDGDGGVESYYLIFTDKGEYKLTDDLLRGNTNVSNWYGLLRRDSCYSFEVSGFRSGLLSSYQNIISKPTKCNCN